MTGPRDTTMFCPICGGPMWEEGVYKEAPEWLSSIILLAESENESDSGGRVVVVLPAINRGGPYFAPDRDSPHQDEVTACDPEVAVSLGITPQQRALQRAWSTLRGRFQSATKPYRPVPPRTLYIPTGYYGSSKFQGIDWETDAFVDFDHEAEYYEADPVQLGDFTAIILQNLETLPQDRPYGRELLYSDSAAAVKCPPEIIQQILSHLLPLDESSSVCNYAIPAVYWKSVLVQGFVLPWLPTLDSQMVDEKDLQLQDSDQWDWEKLVRRLGATSFKKGPLEIEKGALKIPMGLWNRRRIWDLAKTTLTDA